MKKVLLFLSIALFFLPVISAAQSGERILDFKSDITINRDASIVVTELITVVSTNSSIKHGIYRDFPTTYTSNAGKRYKVGFEVLGVKRDGGSEKYQINSISNGKRIYFGDKEVTLSPGVYTYEFTYRVTRELGFFENHDELYWNVTGNDWDFQIDKASATVHLPAGVAAQDVTLTGYTGPQGSRDQNLAFSIDENVIARFDTTGMLNTNEGLTIVVGWPKGFVTPPSASENAWRTFLDNISYLFLLLFFIYYYFLWRKIGVDPKPGAIIAHYEPPQNLDPASIRYLTRMKYDQEAFSASIINMAVKGYLTITKKIINYSLEQTGKNEEKLSEIEKKIAEDLFKGKESFLISTEQYQTLLESQGNLAKGLKSQFGERYFLTNTKHRVLLWIVAIAAFILASINYLGDNAFVGIFMIVWLTGWTTALLASFKMVNVLWFRKKVKAIGLSLFQIPFIAVELLVIGILLTVGGASYTFSILVILAISFTFFILLRRRTVEGRKLQDEIDGFKLFLSVTEKDRLNFHNSPERTPELFEKFLPYALALGVDAQWAQQFNDVFKMNDPHGGGYNPSWYHGAALASMSPSDFSNSLSSAFAGAVASSSTTPGSSSGFSGGGSSGGGGGGGGGGGW